MTHACHSQHGREVKFLQGPKTQSQTTILVELPGGECRQLPKAWTSLADPDPYSLLSAPPLLRLESLLELAELSELRGAELRGVKPGFRYFLGVFAIFRLLFCGISSILPSRALRDG